MTTVKKPNRTSQRLLPFFRSRQQGIDLPDHYAHMFQEDLHLVMPLRGWRPGTGFRVDITPASPETAELIASGLPSEYGTARDLEDAVSHFVESTAQLLSWHGRAIYEIVFEYDDQNKPTSFRLVHIPDECIHNAFLFCWQHRPANDTSSFLDKSATGNPRRRRFFWAWRSRMLIVDVPSELGGRRSMLQTIRMLSQASRGIMGDMVLSEVREPFSKSGYDFALHHDRTETLVARATRRLGWPMRGSADKTVLEFYRLHRYLLFERTKVIIRDHIVNALNDAVRRVGFVMGFSASISFSGVHTRQACEDALRDIQSGELQIGRAWKWLMDRENASEE